MCRCMRNGGRAINKFGRAQASRSGGRAVAHVKKMQCGHMRRRMVTNMRPVVTYVTSRSWRACHANIASAPKRRTVVGTAFSPLKTVTPSKSKIVCSYNILRQNQRIAFGEFGVPVSNFEPSVGPKRLLIARDLPILRAGLPRRNGTRQAWLATDPTSSLKHLAGECSGR